MLSISSIDRYTHKARHTTEATHYTGVVKTTEATLITFVFTSS